MIYQARLLFLELLQARHSDGARRWQIDVVFADRDGEFRMLASEHGDVTEAETAADHWRREGFRVIRRQIGLARLQREARNV